ncbi:MAG: hypothetical protein Ta2G_10490 [Termitinemataceae bacterium]|nr:MAG: hypothetical protein Ta2G_10490 [Termitinemataceae bacterium]
MWTPMFILGFIMISLNRLAMSPIQGFLSLYLLEDLQWDAVGFMWALAAACEMPFIFLSKHFIKRFGDLPLMAFATGAIFLRLMLYAFVPIKAGVILGQCLHAFCYGLFHPAAVAFITRKVPAGQRALGMSLYLSLGSGVPTLIGNFIGGFVVDHVGYRALFIIFSSFAVMGLTLYFFTRRWTKKAQN